MSNVRHVYWTDKGDPNLNEGSIERTDIDTDIDIDRRNHKTIVPQGQPSRPSSCISIRGMASCTGRIVKVYASYAPVSTARTSKPSCTRAKRTGIVRMRPGGASGSRSTPSVTRSIGCNKALMMEDVAASFVP